MRRVAPITSSSNKKTPDLSLRAALLIACATLLPSASAVAESTPAAPATAQAEAPAPVIHKLPVVAAPPGSQEEMVLQALISSLDSVASTGMLRVGEPIEAVRMDDVIKVVLKDTRLMKPEEEGSGVLFGDIIYMVTPLEDNNFSYELTFPSSWTILDAEKPVLMATVAKQHCNGSFWKRLATSADCRLEEISIQPRKNSESPIQLTIAIDAIDYQQKLDTEKEIIDASSNFNVDGILFNSGEGQTFSLEQISAKSSAEGFPTSQLLEFIDKISSFSAIDLEDPDNQEVNQKRAIEFAINLLRIADGSTMQSDTRMTNLLFSEQGQVTVSLGEAGTVAGYTGQEMLSDVRVGFYVKELAVNIPDVPAELQPLSLNLDLTIAKLPLIKMLESLIPVIPVNESDNALVGQLLLRMLLQQPPYLEVNQLQLAGGAFDLQFSGKLETALPDNIAPQEALANSKTPLDLFKGDFSGTIHGLDFLTNQASQRAQQQPELMQLVMAASLLKGLGEATGEDQYDYKIEFSPEKGLLLNGKDMMMFMNAME